MDTDPKEPTTRAGAPVVTRRAFLNKLSLAVGGIGALLMGVPVVGFLLSPLLGRQPQVWVAVGPVNTFELNKTVLITLPDPSPLPWSGVTARSAAWLRRTGDDQFIAFAVNCTHLGCPVRWLPDAEIFMCPCHGGVFYGDGRPAAGPPERQLYRYEARINNGQVELLSGTLPIAPQSGKEGSA
ncbi:MAG TPA: Rieske (2Fe-2S) protein [Roseiflexaceae bacterium]|jgi:menaquinol-cytochrome c reductase iron-sulfur subunit|nr:Rieske (2Fe-2S) protein [Roseiflexaceae bacterium]